MLFLRRTDHNFDHSVTIMSHQNVHQDEIYHSQKIVQTLHLVTEKKAYEIASVLMTDFLFFSTDEFRELVA